MRRLAPLLFSFAMACDEGARHAREVIHDEHAARVREVIHEDIDRTLRGVRSAGIRPAASPTSCCPRSRSWRP